MPTTRETLPAEIAQLPPMEVELDLIARDPNQPRQTGLEAGIEELAAEISLNGLINPIVIRPPFPDEELPRGKRWVLVMGERRTLAFRYLERDRIAARIVPEGELGDRAELLLRQIGENVYNPLNPLDKAAAHARAFRLSGTPDQKSYCERYGVDRTLLNRALKIDEAFAAEIDETEPQGRLVSHLRRACQAGTIQSPEALLILLSLAGDHPKRVRRLLRSANPTEPLSRKAARDLQKRLTTAPRPPKAQPTPEPKPQPEPEPPPEAKPPPNGVVQVPVPLLAAVLERFGVSDVPADPALLVPFLERQLEERRQPHVSV